MKSYYSLGLMSGTSMDGVDASIIQSDGEKRYKVILDKYFEYPKGIYENLTKIRDKIGSSKDLKKFSKNLKFLEKEITLFHAKAVNEINKKSKVNIDFIGFHGQTIFHNAKQKISKQLGDGKLLFKLTKKKVIYNFRQNDLKNGGQGAPLTPIFHKLLINQKKINLPVMILNIGGIANVTVIDICNNIYSCDVGPGNYLIDKWMRLNSKNKYDKNGKTAQFGKINQVLLLKILDNFKNYLTTYDVKDFDISFIRDLSLEDGAATLTEYTSEFLYRRLRDLNIYPQNAMREKDNIFNNIIMCGGGRKNIFLIKSIEKKIRKKIKLIDDFGINGDFVESQAFAYLAIRSYLKIPISFPSTTGVSKPCTGGTIIEN